MNFKLYKIILFSFLLFIGSFVYVEAANLSITPTNSTYQVGDRITVKVVTSTQEPLNAISATVKFDTSIFSVESISKNGSILNFWVTEPSFSNQGGFVKLEGVALNGFSAGSGNVITINLRANREGQGIVSFESGSILANDGQGTNITKLLTGSTFTITERKAIKEEPKKDTPTGEQKIEEDQEKPVVKTLDAPIIRTGKLEGLLAIIGESGHPNSDVVLTFVSKSDSKVFISGKTDSLGNFSIIVPTALRDGNYYANATILKENGEYSKTSENLDIRVGNIFRSIIFYILLIVIFIIFYIFTKKFKTPLDKRQKNIHREVAEAEDIVSKSFKIMRDDIKKEDGADLVEKDLKEAEKIIKGEIEDIKKENDRV